MKPGSPEIDVAKFACCAPLRDRPLVVMGHGGGGSLSHDLLEHVFLPAFGNPVLDRLGDSAVLDLAPPLAGGGRLAFSTDSYVVRPLVFPGGSIGELAINGTVNDLAMSGAGPLFLSAGIGVVAPGIDLGPHRIRPGDAVIVSGTLGDHGMAIMSVREGLGFEAAITSDTAALFGLVATMLAACPALRLLRDPTRGGAAASLNEIASLTKLGIEIDEAAIPIAPAVASACEILGLDPLLVANEGKLLAVVPATATDTLLAAMRSHEHGRAAVCLGHMVAEHPGVVALRTVLGGSRVLPLPIGEQLPRIC